MQQPDLIVPAAAMRVALDEVIGILGNQAALATALGISRASVSNWIKRGRVPAERAIQIEALVGGRVSRQRLRPDFYPAERAASAPVRRGRPPRQASTAAIKERAA